MMIYHTEWKERGLKGLWVDAVASGSALLLLSATNIGVFVVLLSWLACSVLNRIFCKSLGEVFFPEEESEAWSKIFPMLWPKGLHGDTRESLLLSRIKWFINPASWALSFLRFLEWGLLKADYSLKEKGVQDKIDLGLLFLLRISQTILRGVSLLVEGVEGLFSLPYWIGYGLSYVFGFRPPPPPRGDEMVLWDPRVASKSRGKGGFNSEVQFHYNSMS